MEEDDRPKKPSTHNVGMMLDEMSIDELEGRIGLLRAEIERLQLTIGEKSESKTAADAVFKL